MAIIKEVLPKVYSWSEFDEERQLNFNGHFVVHQKESVLIDPPNLSDKGMRELKELVALNISTPVKAILLTNVHHDRMSQELKKIFPIPIYINEKDQPLLDFKSDKTTCRKCSHYPVVTHQPFCILNLILENSPAPVSPPRPPAGSLSHEMSEHLRAIPSGFHTSNLTHAYSRDV